MKHPGLIFLFVLTFAACSRTESTTDTATTTTTDTAPAAATGTAASTVPPRDLQFATTASMANLYEIQASQLALTKATGAQYQEFAQTMVAQHTQIGDSYKPIAEQQGLPMPTTLEGEFATLYQVLVDTPAGQAFNAVYRTQMINTHTSAVSLFQTEANTGEDPALKAFAAQWLPTVQHHLEMANALPQ